MPELFSTLTQIIDKTRKRGRFIVTGFDAYSAPPYTTVLIHKHEILQRGQSSTVDYTTNGSY